MTYMPRAGAEVRASSIGPDIFSFGILFYELHRTAAFSFTWGEDAGDIWVMDVAYRQ